MPLITRGFGFYLWGTAHIVWLFFFLIAMLRLPATGSVGGEPPERADFDRLQEFFKWAEYDSVIVLGEHLSLNRNLKDKEVARVRLDLGVAYYAKGRVTESILQFIKSQQLDSGIVLDPLYADKEIMDHYRFTLESQAYLDSVRQVDGQRFVGSARGRAKVDLVFSLIGFSAGVIGATLAANSYSEGEMAYRDLEYAATVSGKPADYLSAKKAVRAADRRTLAFSVMGAGSFIAGGCMLAEFLVLKKRFGNLPIDGSFSLTAKHAGVLVAWEF